MNIILVDPELREEIEHLIADVMEPQTAQCHTFMKKEGIIISSVSADAVKASYEEIPPGAHLPAPHCAQLVVVKVAG